MATQLFEAGSPDVLYLIDLSGYVFRAYHAIAPLTSPSGEPTQAIFGTVNMLERLVRQCKPKLLAVAMDSSTPTFRKEMYPEYKANRPPPPDDLRQQMRRVGEVIEAFPIQCFQQDGVEADDVIATVVTRCREQQLKVVIVSADKDLMQLVGDDVVLWDTMRDRVFGITEVEERFGVPVNKVRDVLALMGDSSDNIPGVPSVGPKTARDLINEYGDLDGIYQHLDQIKRKKLRETLTSNEQQARMSQVLVTLKNDLELAFEPATLTYASRNAKTLRELYADLGFQRHLATLENELGGSAEQPQAKKNDLALGEAVCITDEAGLHTFAEQLKQSRRISLFPCLMGDASASFSLIGIGLAAQAGASCYIPLGHRYMGAPEQLKPKRVLSWLGEQISEHPLSIGGHDVKTALVALGRAGLQLDSCHFDSLLASFLLDPAAAHDIERVIQTELGLSLAPLDSLVKKGRKRTPFDELTVEEASGYAGPRAEAIQHLWEPMSARIEEETLSKIWTDIELPLVPLLAQIEQTGILLDTATLLTIGKTVGEQLNKLEQQAHSIAGKDFNVNSPKQLEKLLFDELGLKPIKRTKTSRSTDAETLESLSDEHELPRVILEIRQLAKLKGTYIDALPALVNPSTGRLHTRWHQEGAATGRLSSSDPNLQNIPIRTELGRSIRAAFIAPPGFELVSADYSQVELRVLAHLAQDAVLLDAFRTGQDIHQRTAMEIFEVDADEVDAELRRRAKAVNFGVIYGQGDSALAKSLGIPRMEASQFIAAYFRRYEGVRTFMDRTLESARASGSVRTLLGRRRIVPDVLSGNRARRLAAERIVMNTPIQGTAADIIKLAMLKLREPVAEGARMLLTVHDELVFEVPQARVNEAKQTIVQAMESAYPLDVPLVVDVGSGPNWKSAH